MGRTKHKRRYDRRRREREGEAQMSNDWMNDQLRARGGRTVTRDDRAGDEINDALRVARGLPPRHPANRAVEVGPEPPTTAPLAEWRKWAEEAAPALDDQGRLPTEEGYTRPAADSFGAMVARKQRRAEQ